MHVSKPKWNEFYCVKKINWHVRFQVECSVTNVLQMYAIPSMKGVGIKEVKLSYLGNGTLSRYCRAKDKAPKHHTLVGQFVSHRVELNYSETTL